MGAPSDLGPVSGPVPDRATQLERRAWKRGSRGITHQVLESIARERGLSNGVLLGFQLSNEIAAELGSGLGYVSSFKGQDIQYLERTLVASMYGFAKTNTFGPPEAFTYDVSSS